MKRRLIFTNIIISLISFLLAFLLFLYSKTFTKTSDLVIPAILVFIIVILISVLIAVKTSKSFSSDINNINLFNPDKENTYRELTPLVERIDEMNMQVSERIDELKIEHDKQDTMRREFTANVSHELKTPLTSISGYAEIIRDGLVKKDKISSFAGKIHDEAARLITLVGDIIKLSQLDAKDINVKIEEIDLYNTAEAVINHLMSQAEHNKITIKLNGEHAIISGAEQIIEEMIFNLCDNAIKYNVPDGKVYVNIQQCVDGVELSVKDTGIGISKDDVEHIFERFFRADKSHSKEIGGTGLGLSIVKHGAIFHGASLDVKSKPGKGTTIKICF